MEDRQQLWLVAIWRARFFLAVVAGGIFILIGWWSFWRPLWREISTVTAKEHETKIAVEGLNQELAERQEARDILSTLSVSGRQKLSLLVRTKPETAELIRALDRLVVAAGGVLESVDVSEGGETTLEEASAVKSPTGAARLMFQVHVQGMDYRRLLQLFRQFETHLPLLLVDSFIISDKTPGIELGLHWFYFPPP